MVEFTLLCFGPSPLSFEEMLFAGVLRPVKEMFGVGFFFCKGVSESHLFGRGEGEIQSVMEIAVAQEFICKM